MTRIELRYNVHNIRGERPGGYRLDHSPLTRWPEAPRYCASCGCRLRTTNRARICDPCDDKARAAHESSADRWYREHGV